MSVSELGRLAFSNIKVQEMKQREEEHLEKVRKARNEWLQEQEERIRHEERKFTPFERMCSLGSIAKLPNIEEK